MATYKDSRAQEKRAAKDYGGTVNSGSGNGPWRKNDVRSDVYSIECKVTDKYSFSLKLKELIRARMYATLDNRTMLWEIRMCDRDFVLMPRDDFLVLDEYRQRHEEVSD